MSAFLNFNDLAFGPHASNPDSGVHAVAKFDNGYGVSVIKTDTSFGGGKGLYELAVIRFYNKTQWNLCFDTHVSATCVGHLNTDGVSKYMKRIQMLED